MIMVVTGSGLQKSTHRKDFKDRQSYHVTAFLRRKGWNWQTYPAKELREDHYKDNSPVKKQGKNRCTSKTAQIKLLAGVKHLSQIFKSM